MQDYERKSVFEVVEEINRTYFLPDIQRSFVWEPEQVYALFDSIMRDYPISTFLFWKQKGAYLKSEKIKKLEFVRTSKENNRENTEMNQAKEYSLVLDGQQRLTTFYLVLKGNYIIRNNPYELYLNVLSGDEELEDGILYEFKFFNKTKGASFSEDDGERKIWLRVKDIYDINIGSIFSELTTISRQIEGKFNLTLNDSQKNSIARLCQYLKSEKIIYDYPEIEKDYDKVLDIFVRTNSGGTPLSYSDLLFSTIKSKWTDAREKFDKLLLTINDNERYRFSNDFVLKTTLVLNAKSTEEVRYKTKNFKSDLIQKLQRDWNDIERSISLAIDIVKDRLLLTSYKTIPSNNAVVPIICWIYKNKYKGIGSGKRCVNDAQIASIRAWLTKALLSGIFGGQSDTILYKCKESIDANTSNTFPGQDMERRINTETKKTMKLDSDFLDNVWYNSRDSYLVLSLCYGGTVNFQPRYKGNLPEQDHIFCQSQLKKAGIPDSKINSIYNIRYIASTENKVKLDTPYSEWITALKNDKEREEVMQKHLLPWGDWTVKNYNVFLEKRKELMMGKFR